MTQNRPARRPPRSRDHTLQRRLTATIQVLLVIGAVVFVASGQWSNAAYTVIVIILSIAPLVLRRRLHVDVPPEFQLAALGFVVVAVVLGSALGFYARFWWWDIALHATSGFLLGMIGFLAVFLLNGSDHLPTGMRPSFVAVFGFTFAVTLGVFWEIWEFVGDLLVPSLDMQVAASGVRDTMTDLIVDTVGAAVVATLGYLYVRTGRQSFVGDWLADFLRRNPALFTRRGQRDR